MHRAEANMVVCAKALLNVARKLQTDYKTPFFEGSFYGVTDTSMAFREFAKLLNDPSLTERTEALIAREEAKINAALDPWREKLRGKRVLLYTGGVKSWSIVSALQDLGMDVVATGTNKSTEEDKARIREIMGEKTRMIPMAVPRHCSVQLEYQATFSSRVVATCTQHSRRIPSRHHQNANSATKATAA
jgi:nitrogenase molybdenum-cofactor synthesis protein NifE